MKTKIPLPLDKRAWRPSPLVGQIVLVTTQNADGQSNIVPKSWVSMMAFDPPLVALGCNRAHWTAQNILRSGEFVINIPGDDLAEAVWQMPTRPHPRPVESVGLTPRAAQVVSPPLVEECKAHLECLLEKQLAFGEEIMLIGRIVAGSLDCLALESPEAYAYLRPLLFLEDATFGVIEKSQKILLSP